jgi:hypothetical protein
LDTQLERAYAALALPTVARAAGATLLFVRGRVAGAEGSALLLHTAHAGGQVAMRVVAPTDHEELCYRENLRALARAPGLELLAMGRIVPDSPRTIAGIAIATMPVSDDIQVRLVLPEEWGGRAMLGLDRLQTSYLVGAVSREIPVVAMEERAASDPLVAHRRRVQRLALAGARSLPPAAIPEVMRESAALERRLLAGAAQSLRSIVAAIDSPPRAASGRAVLARAWLVAASYQQGCWRRIQRARWKAVVVGNDL